MKKARKITGIILVVAMLMNVLNLTLVFGNSLGENLHSSTLDIGERVSLAKGVFWHTGYSDKITENYIEYTPGTSVIPIISHGNDIHGAASFNSVANMAKAEGQHVIAGLNGDFFEMSNGVPVGLTIKKGELLTSESVRRPSVGFYKDGSVIIGRPNIVISAEGDGIGKGFSYVNLNKALTVSSGVVLYTRTYGNDFTNKAKIASYNVLLEMDKEKILINDYFEGRVVETKESSGATFIPEGHMLLSISLNTNYPNSLSRLMDANHGDLIRFTVTGDQDWSQVDYAIGSGDKLVENGRALTPADKEVHPRTAVGIKADGSAIFYTVDGRQAGHSRGLSLEALSARMIELGCVEAVNMDGGGSTALHGIYPGQASLGLINQLSQSSLRSCANYILLINTAKPTGNLSNLHIYPYDFRVLAGSEIKLDVKASDNNYYPVSPPSKLTFSQNGSIGSFNSDNVFIAGQNKAKGSLSVNTGGLAQTSTNVEIVEKPESINILNEATGKAVTTVNMFGGEEINLKASATYKKMPLLSSDKAYKWTVIGDIGSIDEEGIFKAADINRGTGQIQASVMGVTKTINVSITSDGWLLEDFEGKDNFFTSKLGEGIRLTANEDLTKVKYGYKSALIEYDFTGVEDEMVSLPISANFSKSPKMIGFYLYGDGSGNNLELIVTGKEARENIYATSLDFKGWRLITVDLPAGTTSLNGINLVKAGKDKGNILLDQFVAGIGHYVDTEGPLITMEAQAGLLKATVKDEIDKNLSPSKISLTLDGRNIEFNYDQATGDLKADLLIEDGFMHRLAITAQDESGNISRKGISLMGELGDINIFSDTKNHWAKNNIDYLYGLGIISGVQSGQGLKYNPEKSITRAEFAVLMKNWLGQEAQAYIYTDLPFIDKATIPVWAMDSVKAMYGMGIIAGTGTDKGLVFNPTGSISRQEVMTIIGRTQARGYGEANLDIFVDNKSVADWALPYVSSLVKQGVISGSNGKLNPKNFVTRAEVATIITGLN